MIRRVCDGTPTPIQERNPDIPGWLVEIIERLHAKDPSARFRGAAEVAELLEQHLAQLQDPSLPPVVHDWAERPAPVPRTSILRRVAGADGPGRPSSSSSGRRSPSKGCDSSRPRPAPARIPVGTIAASRPSPQPAKTRRMPQRKRLTPARVVTAPAAATVARDRKDATTKKADSGKSDGSAPPATAVARDGVTAPVGGTRPPKGATQLVILPPVAPMPEIDETRLVETYRQSFLGKQYDFRRLRISAPGGATNLVRPDPRGVRITIPAKLGESVAIETKFAIHGDFDLMGRLRGPRLHAPPDRMGHRARGADQAPRRLGQDRLALPVCAAQGYRLFGGLREEGR